MKRKFLISQIEFASKNREIMFVHYDDYDVFISENLRALNAIKSVAKQQKWSSQQLSKNARMLQRNRNKNWFHCARRVNTILEYMYLHSLLRLCISSPHPQRAVTYISQWRFRGFLSRSPMWYFLQADVFQMWASALANGSFVIGSGPLHGHDWQTYWQ